jgi:hypothetical protein
MVCYPLQPIVRTVNLDINALMPVDQAELQARQRQARPQGTLECHAVPCSAVLLLTLREYWRG